MPTLNPQLRDGICRFYPAGECTLVEAVELVKAAIAHCREHRIGKMYIDGRGLTGVPIPTLVDRFLMAEEWAQEARGLVVAVLVTDPRYLHPQKFAVTVARDMGFKSDVFTSEAEALEWIESVDPS
jgi:hypothetical protein